MAISIKSNLKMGTHFNPAIRRPGIYPREVEKNAKI